MQRLRLSLFCLLFAGCQISSVSNSGPTPSISSVMLDVNGALSAPNLPQTIVNTIHISGSHFAPLPIDVLSGTPDLLMPSVSVTLGGTTTELTGVGYNPNDGSLTANVPANLPLGTYSLTVTNPSGGAVTLPAALQIIPPPTLSLCSTVTPAFGYVNGRTTIDICADNTGGHGLYPIPEAFLRVGPSGGGNVLEVPLIRNELVSQSGPLPPLTDASVMSAVVPAANETRGAGIVVGGPYDIRVLNPDGSSGIITKAFTVLAQPPPTVTSVSPDQGDTSQGGTLTLKIDGTNFADPNAGLSPRQANIYLMSEPYDPNQGCVSAAGCYPCSNPAANGNTQATCTLPSVPSGSYVVRYWNLQQGAYGDFSAFAVTNPAGNVNPATAEPNLVQGRMAHGAATAQDDLGQRYLYVIGGQSGTTFITALPSIEVATVSLFGDVSPWRSVASTLPGPITGLSTIAYGQYLFALGGRDSAGNPVQGVWRARVLGSDTTPELDAPTVTTGGSLPAGFLSYRVSAVMGGSGDNPNGETLASDPESINLSGTERTVQLSWGAVTGAASYRVYRTKDAGQLAGTEQLLAENVTGTSFTDTGSQSVGTTLAPSSGALGVWVAMSNLSSPRADAAATLATDTNGQTFVYVVGGRLTSATTETNTYDFAPITVSGGVPTTGTFTAGGNTLVTARAESIVLTVDANSSPHIVGLGQQYVTASFGTNGGSALDDYLIAKVLPGGSLGTWSTANINAADKRFGALGVLVNNILFDVGGQSTGYLSQGKTAVVCSAANTTCATTDPPTITTSGGNSGFSLTAPRYRGTMIYLNGFFYSMGGASSASSVESSTDRTSYN